MGGGIVMPADMVSVIMVVRNEGSNIADAIESVLGQSHKSLELLVVDGQSRDSTVSIVRKYMSEDDRIRLLENSALVIPSGLNVGLRAAVGDFIARIDGHCRWSSQYLEIGLRILQERQDVVGVGGIRQAVGEGLMGCANALALSTPVGVGNSIYHYSRESQYTDHVTNGLYRIKEVTSVRGWDEELLVNEDVDFDYRLLQRGGSLYYEPQMSTRWKVRSSYRSLAQQYRRYGRGKAMMIRKNSRQAMRLRHLAPPMLVVAYSVATFSSFKSKRPLMLLLAAHCAVLFAGVNSLVRTGRSGVTLPVAMAAVPSLAIMHLCWGWGFLEASLFALQPQRQSR